MACLEQIHLRPQPASGVRRRCCAWLLPPGRGVHWHGVREGPGNWLSPSLREEAILKFGQSGGQSMNSAELRQQSCIPEDDPEMSVWFSSGLPPVTPHRIGFQMPECWLAIRGQLLRLATPR